MTADAAPERLTEITESLVRTNAANNQWQRDLAFAHINLGRVQEMHDGNEQRALTEFQKAISIMQKLADGEPAQPQWKLDLSRTYQRVGDALILQNKDREALGWFQKDFEITRQLSDEYPDNAQIQGELAIAYQRIGAVLEDEAKHEEALASYRKSVEITQKLADSEPSNSQWQHCHCCIFSSATR
jgi:eukaryotic-like serine/threonine-protein kinase